MSPEQARAVYASGEEKTVELLLTQAQEIARLQAEMAVLVSAVGNKNRRFCQTCFERQQKLDRMEVEVLSLRQKLRFREKKAEEGFFGSSTPSSKKPVKANSGAGKKKKKSGAKPGHQGYGRKKFRRDEADQVISIPVTNGHCDCGGTLKSRGDKERSVLDLPPIRPDKLLYLLGRKQCASCGTMHYARASSVLRGWFYGNGLVSQTAVMHYVHGIPMGTIERMLGLPRSSLIDTFHDLAKLFAPALPKLMGEYRLNPVKHADETPWRCQGQSGYAWVFYCQGVSLFLFRHTRSADTPLEVFGNQPLPGVLVVDRYVGYSRVPCKVQYCYEHLKRNLQDLVKKHSDSSEIKRFADVVIPLIRQAIQLRTQPIPDERFYAEAATLKENIVATMKADAQDEAIQNYQEIFRSNPKKLYHWADDRRVLAHNNTAERELRPIVIARKVSFGSQSDKGRHTREVLASILNTLAQRGLDPAEVIKTALDRLAIAPDLDPFELLFRGAPAPDKQDQQLGGAPAADVQNSPHQETIRPPQTMSPPLRAQSSKAPAPSPWRKTTVQSAGAACVALFLLFAYALFFLSSNVEFTERPVAAVVSDSAQKDRVAAPFKIPTQHDTTQDKTPPHHRMEAMRHAAEQESTRGPPACLTQK